MRQMMAFIKKEFVEMTRTGKLAILLILFIMFGIMNPAIAKLTPWLFKSMSGELAKQGMVIKETTVDAMTSWGQFFKNGSMCLIVIVAVFSGILTAEYQKGTLIIMLTKGLDRCKVIVAKSFTVFFSWTICYWISFGITYGYNAYFWDNGIAHNLFLAVASLYVLGLWLLSLLILGSVIFSSGASPMLFTGGAAVISYLISMVPDLSKYVPTKLLESGSLLDKTIGIKDIIPSLIIALALIVLFEGMSVYLFKKKRI